MSLTRIDCQIFRGRCTDQGTSSYTALNPCCVPGSLLIAGAIAPQATIGSQIACKLALEHFVDGVLSCFLENASPREEFSSAEEDELAQWVLESAFKRANSLVYQFGHRLAAGGRMSSTLLGLVIVDGIAAAGRVGEWSVYLFRNGQLFPFFFSDRPPELHTEFVGANSVVKVETASVSVVAEDLIVAFSGTLSREKEMLLARRAPDLNFQNTRMCEELAEDIFGDVNALELAVVAGIGPEAFYLSEAPVSK